jgi:hypothetical protein
MAIRVVRESEELGGPFERCCFCHTPTPFWYEPNDVPVCERCAKSKKLSEIPTKEEWIKQEEKYESEEDND